MERKEDYRHVTGIITRARGTGEEVLALDLRVNGRVIFLHSVTYTAVGEGEMRRMAEKLNHLQIDFNELINRIKLLPQVRLLKDVKRLNTANCVFGCIF